MTRTLPETEVAWWPSTPVLRGSSDDLSLDGICSWADMEKAYDEGYRWYFLSRDIMWPLAQARGRTRWWE